MRIETELQEHLTAAERMIKQRGTDVAAQLHETVDKQAADITCRLDDHSATMTERLRDEAASAMEQARVEATEQLRSTTDEQAADIMRRLEDNGTALAERLDDAATMTVTTLDQARAEAQRSDLGGERALHGRTPGCTADGVGGYYQPRRRRPRPRSTRTVS